VPLGDALPQSGEAFHFCVTFSPLGHCFQERSMCLLDQLFCLDGVLLSLLAKTVAFQMRSSNHSGQFMMRHHAKRVARPTSHLPFMTRDRKDDD
jgi:hypothetical protein